MTVSVLPATAADGAASHRPIARFVRMDMVGAAASIVFVVFVNGVIVREPAVWLVVPALAALLGALWLASRVVDTRPITALVLTMAGHWVIALVVSVMFPFLWPVMILAVLLPLVLATPYLHAGSLGSAIAGAAVMGGVVASIGLLLDDEGVITDIDDTAEILLVIGSLAALIVPIALVIRQNNAIQRAALDEAVSLNIELSQSEAELSASRRRVVDAADIERSRIERDLHDGAQQRLLALGMRLRLLESQTVAAPDVHEAVTGLAGEIDAAVDELRELAHGIYPPVLEAHGLGDALAAAVRRSPGDVTLDVDEIGRHGRSVESALYFTTLEALSNAAKYAADAPVAVTLSDGDGSIRLDVADTGPGFVVADARRSLGLLSMNDRVDAVGGTLTVESAPGSGTTVTAIVPTGDDHRLET